jgi:hypothetical protein
VTTDRQDPPAGGVEGGLPTDRHASTDHRDSPERIEYALPTEPIESSDATEPTAPIERIDPAEPIDRIDPVEPIDKMEPLDPMLSSEPGEPDVDREPSTVSMATSSHRRLVAVTGLPSAGTARRLVLQAKLVERESTRRRLTS